MAKKIRGKPFSKENQPEKKRGPGKIATFRELFQQE